MREANISFNHNGFLESRGIRVRKERKPRYRGKQAAPRKCGVLLCYAFWNCCVAGFYADRRRTRPLQSQNTIKVIIRRGLTQKKAEIESCLILIFFRILIRFDADACVPFNIGFYALFDAAALRAHVGL